jgi:hypothetical protein
MRVARHLPRQAARAKSGAQPVDQIGQFARLNFICVAYLNFFYFLYEEL